MPLFVPSCVFTARSSCPIVLGAFSSQCEHLKGTSVRQATSGAPLLRSLVVPQSSLCLPQMLNQMTRAAITHAHVCHLIKIPPSELCLQLLQRRWCVISAERRSPPRMLWRPTGKLTQVLCRHVCAHSGCTRTKSNAATKTQRFPINFQ